MHVEELNIIGIQAAEGIVVVFSNNRDLVMVNGNGIIYGGF